AGRAHGQGRLRRCLGTPGPREARAQPDHGRGARRAGARRTAPRPHLARARQRREARGDRRADHASRVLLRLAERGQRGADRQRGVCRAQAMRLAFIGLGTMGGRMAANLQRAGHEVRAHDLRRVEGFNWFAAAPDAVQGCELVFTSVPGPDDVDAVAAKLKPVLRSGTAWFDLSTNSPSRVRRLHAELAKQGVQFLDAPVSGGPSGAQSGKLAIWVGGDRRTYERYESVLRAFGDQPLYIGAIGAGTVAKLAHNCGSFAIHAAMAEVFTLGVKAGVDPLSLFRALRQGAS